MKTFYFIKRKILLSLCEILLIWPNSKDLLLVIERLKEQVREVLGDLGRCEAQGGQLLVGPSPLFWLLVAAVAFSAGPGALRP